MKRIVAGLTLVGGKGRYTTEDGRYVIERDYNAMTNCDGPHPVRTGRGRGYQCPGDEEHYYPTWSVWEAETGLDPIGGAEGTLKQAAYLLAKEIEKETHT